MSFEPDKFVYKFLTSGNIKLGKMGVWSTLMGDDVFDVPEMDMAVQGTCSNCSECKKDCYVRKSYRYPSVIYSHARNTVGLREVPEKVFSDLDKQLVRADKNESIKIIRLNQSGDIESEEEFLRWCELARKHPKITFYVYTKAFDYVLGPLNANKVPLNFTVLFSVWHHVGVAEYESVKHLPNVKAFIYDDGETELKPETYCMAYNEKGKLNHDITCDKCRKCFNIKGKKLVGCKAH